jgi:hypothetical protein
MIEIKTENGFLGDGRPTLTIFMRKNDEDWYHCAYLLESNDDCGIRVREILNIAFIELCHKIYPDFHLKNMQAEERDIEKQLSFLRESIKTEEERLNK